MPMLARCVEMILFDWCEVLRLICCTSVIPEAPFTVVLKIEMNHELQQSEIQLKSHLHTELW